MSFFFKNKRVLITGGTGSLGQTLVRRILATEMPEQVTVLSRDEAKQYAMRNSTPDGRLQFRVGDVRDLHSVSAALRDQDVVIHAAALKQVPTCEYFPHEAVMTNVLGAENVIRAIEQFDLPIEVVVGISTDKACKPVNTMGMTKAIQERLFIQGNLRRPRTRFVCVRYGNVLASRGSVVPLFQEQIARGGPVTITTREMTRFLLSLDYAADTVFAALQHAEPGETFVPRAPSALVVDIAKALIGSRPIHTIFTGIRPGEKIHEIMVSEEEAPRVRIHGQWLAIAPMLPELRRGGPRAGLPGEYSSSETVMGAAQTEALLREAKLLDG